MVAAHSILPFVPSDGDRAPLVHADFAATRTLASGGIFDAIEEVVPARAGATPLETHHTLRQAFTDYHTHGRLIGYLSTHGVHCNVHQPYHHEDKMHIIVAIPKEQYAHAITLLESPPSEEKSYFDADE